MVSAAFERDTERFLSEDAEKKRDRLELLKLN